jgi:transcription elongation factor Elf1
MATFEDQTVDIRCPNCGHINSVAVREFEEHTVGHLVCVSCKAGIKIDAQEFRQHLDTVRKELEEFEREAMRDSRQKVKRPRKGDFQI